MIQCGMEYYLYWWRDHNHTDPWTEGYIGITKNLDQRKVGHRHTMDWFREDLEFEILKEGLTEVEARDIEREYRPRINIGWNKAVGGGMPPNTKKGHCKGKAPWNKGLKGTTKLSEEHKAKLHWGRPHTEESRKKMSEIRTRLYGRDWEKTCKEWKESGLNMQQFSKINKLDRGKLSREIKKWL